MEVYLWCSFSQLCTLVFVCHRIFWYHFTYELAGRSLVQSSCCHRSEGVLWCGMYRLSVWWCCRCQPFVVHE